VRLPASKFGVTMIHEHFLVDLTCYWRPEDGCTITNSPATLPSLSAMRTNAVASQDNLGLGDNGVATEELRHYGLSGGCAIVNVTPAAVDRNVRGLQLKAQATGLNIIALRGYYIEATHSPLLKSLSVNGLVEFVRDLIEGIQGMDVRAGVIGELGAISYPMPNSERRVVQTGRSWSRSRFTCLRVKAAPRPRQTDGPERPAEQAHCPSTKG
jgi:phosphotriesterase-related protein